MCRSWSRRRKVSPSGNASCWPSSKSCRPRTRNRKRRGSSVKSRSFSETGRARREPLHLTLDSWPYTRDNIVTKVPRVSRPKPAMPLETTLSLAKKPLRIDDEVRFIRSWLEKPLATGAVMPSGKLLARAMAKCVDPEVEGPVIELGPGTGAVTAALVEQGIEPCRLVLVEFNPTFCRLLRTRYPDATVVQGDAYGI